MNAFESKQHIKIINTLHEAFCFCKIIDNDVSIFFCNNSFYNVFKTKKENIINKKISQCKDSIQKVFELNTISSYIINGGRFSLFLEEINKHVNVSIFPLDKNSFAAIVDDVTQKKFLENKLLIYKRFADQVNEGLMISDLNGKIIYMNRFLKNILSIGEDFKVENILDIYKEDFKKEYFEKILPLLTTSIENQWKSETQIITHYEEQILVTSNFFVIHENDSSTKYIANIITDISKEAITNQLLRENEKKLRKFQEIANLGSWEIILSDFSVGFSKEMYSILEIDESVQIDFEFVKKLINFSENNIRLNLIEAKQYDKLNLVNREVRITTKTKKIKYLKLDGEIIYDDFSVPIKLMGTCVDVTHNIELEKKIQHSQKMESLNQFSSGIAHNFNNILTAILGSADDIFYDDTFDQKNITNRILEIKKTVKDAKEIIRSLVSENHLSSSVFDIDRFIMSKKEVLNNLIRNDIQLQIDLNCKKNIEFDDSELNQIIMNLIGNSLYAIEERKDLKTEDKKIILSTSLSNSEDTDLDPTKEYCVLKVTDNGIGISQDIITKIFDPFFTTKPSGKGSGIGLSTVFNCVKKWKGSVSVESVPMEFTKFTVMIPISYKDLDENKEDEEFSNSHSISNLSLNILFVEDDIAIRQASPSILKKLGHNVYIAKNGKEALEIFKKKEIDIIITDIIMPEMTGIELFEEVIKINKDIKFLFTSGYRSGLLTEEMAKKYPFVQKPYDFADIIKKIEEISKEIIVGRHPNANNT